MTDERLNQKIEKLNQKMGQALLCDIFVRLADKLASLPAEDSIAWAATDAAGYRMILRVARPSAPMYCDEQARVTLKWEKVQKVTSERFKLYLNCHVGKIHRPVLNLSCTASGVWHGQVAELKGDHTTGTKEEVCSWAEGHLQRLELASKLPELPEDCT